MKSRRFQEEFEKHGTRAAGSQNEMLRAMTAALIKDLQMGKNEGGEERLMQIAKMARARQLSVKPAVCLACTELPLALHRKKNQASFEYDDFIYINSTAAHINAIFDFATMPENELPTGFPSLRVWETLRPAEGHTFAVQIQVGQCEVEAQPLVILPQPAVASLLEFEGALHDPERMPHLRPYSGLHPVLRPL
jgi:hypothetical protein